MNFKDFNKLIQQQFQKMADTGKLFRSNIPSYDEFVEYTLK